MKQINFVFTHLSLYKITQVHFKHLLDSLEVIKAMVAMTHYNSKKHLKKILQYFFFMGQWARSFKTIKILNFCFLHLKHGLIDTILY
jgi:hypothetical protein